MVRHLRQISIVFAIVVSILLSACGGTSSGTNTPSSPPVNQLGTYTSPSWWNGKDCDKGHNPEAYVLTTWHGIQVCGPLPDKTGKNTLEDFHGHGASQLEFECPELIARYMVVAYGLKSLGKTNGYQVVDNYTNPALEPGTPFHKVPNDGSIHLVPTEGDVLSYGTEDPGHASIVVDSTGVKDGTGPIKVIEQNVAESGTAKLTMSNWIIQHDPNHIGTVASWMTTRPVTSQQPTPTPTPNILVVHPTSLTVNGSPPCNKMVDVEIECILVLSAPSTNTASISWSVTVNYTSTCPFNPDTRWDFIDPTSGMGVLAPGQQIQVTLGIHVGCVDPSAGGEAVGNFVFKGGSKPVVVNWKDPS